jgi:hypothetical protein
MAAPTLLAEEDLVSQHTVFADNLATCGTRPRDVISMPQEPSLGRRPSVGLVIAGPNAEVGMPCLSDFDGPGRLPVHA